MDWGTAAYCHDARGGYESGLVGCGQGRGFVEEAVIAAVD
jgi:hypothetical protein